MRGWVGEAVRGSAMECEGVRGSVWWVGVMRVGRLIATMAQKYPFVVATMLLFVLSTFFICANSSSVLSNV